MDSLIEVVVVGLSHRTAPVAVREKLAVVPEAIEPTLRAIGAVSGLREAALLCTCNRVEIYAVGADREGALAALREDLATRAGIPESELEEHLYFRTDAQAVHHLFRVASSLDSLVLGEPQILGQVKTTHDTAVRCGTAGPLLNLCFTRAFRVAKRVRRETAIARNPVSVSSVAIELARQVFGGFEGRTVLIVGAGKMADLAARALGGQGASLMVTNRTAARAEELAARIGAAVHPFDDLAGALGKADIVLASTGARQPVLTRALVGKVQRGRRGRPLYIFDIAVPRDVEPACAELEGIYVADIDDLQKVAGGHREGRRTEADRAEAIVEQELVRFVESYRGRRVGPTISALRARVLGVAKIETEKLVTAMPGLGERERRAIFELTEGIAKKILHAPQMALKKDTDDGLPLVLAVQRLFELSVVETVDPPEGVSPDEGKPTAAEVGGPQVVQEAQEAQEAGEGGKKATGR
jgi:glutamyl-tRNA reductase